MKQILTSLALGAVLLTSGCSTVAPGEDSVIVRSEQALEISYTTMDTYLKWADANRSTLSLKEVDLANKIQTWGKSWLRQLGESIEDYKKTGDQGYYHLALQHLSKINDLILEVKALEESR